MNRDTRSLIIFLCVIVVLVAVYAMVFISKSGREQSSGAYDDKSQYNAANTVQREQPAFENSDIDAIIKATDLENEIMQTDDMNSKLGFVPEIARELPSGLRLAAVYYIREDGVAIEKSLKDVPEEYVSGIKFLYYSDTEHGEDTVYLYCRKMSEAEAEAHKMRIGAGEVTEESYGDISVAVASRLITLVKPKYYAEIVEEMGDPFDEETGVEYMADVHVNNQMSPYATSEWYKDGVDYELMILNSKDTNRALLFAKELIDLMNG